MTNINQALRYCYRILREVRLQVYLNTLIGLLLVALDLLFVWTTKGCIDVATHAAPATSRLLFPNTLRGGLLLLGLIILSQLALAIAARWIRALLGVKAQNVIQQKLFSHLLHARFINFHKTHSAGYTNRLERDVRDVINCVTELIPSFLTTVVKFVGAFFLLFYLDRTLALVVVGLLPFFILCSKMFVTRVHKISKQQRAQEQEIQTTLQESLHHVLVLKTLQSIPQTLQYLSGQQQHLRGIVAHRTKYSTFSQALLNGGFGLGYLVTFGWGVYHLQIGVITYGAMLAFVQLVGQIQGPVRNLMQFVPLFINSATAAERLLELENIPMESHSDERKKCTAFHKIELRDVSFRYAPTSRKVLEHFSHTFTSGSITAVLGETGSGKTTLFRLLLALIQPTEGLIGVEYKKGEGLQALQPSDRSLFAYVPQGNTLMHGTLRSNLQCGAPDATEKEMWDALDASAADFVRALPQGLDTPIGENGGGFSEGQAQRIAIARALLHSAPILLLDEATSALDAATAQRVLEKLVSLGRTVVFITHRQSFVPFAQHTIRL